MITFNFDLKIIYNFYFVFFDYDNVNVKRIIENDYST